MAADAIATAGRPRLAPVSATAEAIDRFRAALAARDIVPPESIIADGSIHRCDAAGKNGNPRIFESDSCHGVLQPSPKGDIINI